MFYRDVSEILRSDSVSPAKRCQEFIKKILLDGKAAKAHERNFYEVFFE